MLLQPMLKESPDKNSLLIIIDYYGLFFWLHLYPTSQETPKMFSCYATLFLSTKLCKKNSTNHNVCTKDGYREIPFLVFVKTSILHITNLLDYPGACPDEPLHILVARAVFCNQMIVTVEINQHKSGL
jgi:hypothetical protein